MERPLKIPAVTAEELAAFRESHFSSHSTAAFSTSLNVRPFETYGGAATQYPAEVEEYELGYYPDGVKRTLTDEQIAMFRFSEIQKLLSIYIRLIGTGVPSDYEADLTIGAKQMKAKKKAEQEESELLEVVTPTETTTTASEVRVDHQKSRLEAALWASHQDEQWATVDRQHSGLTFFWPSIQSKQVVLPEQPTRPEQQEQPEEPEVGNA